MKKMKANAKKLLALIMAMVMVLSLAAPAMATSGENDAGANQLVAQSVATQTDIVDAGDGSGKYTVVKTENGKETTLAAGNVTDSTQPKGVTVVYKEGGVIGKPKAATYTVTYKVDDKVEATETVTVGTESGTKSFQDVSPWVDLEEGQTVQIGSKYYLVDGTIYQEKQLNGSGLYVPYFQLFKADEANKSFKTDETPLYFKGLAGNELKNANDISKALESATQCDIFGHDVTGKKNVKDAGCTLPTTPVENTDTTYSFTTMNVSDGLTVSGTEVLAVGFKEGTDKTTGSFQVSIKASTTKLGADGKPVGASTIAYITNVDEAKKILADKWAANNTAKLENVEAASGNYLTVTVSKIATADAYATDSDLLRSKNVTYYKSGEKNEAVLIDLSKDGWYNGTTDKGANANAIAANTEALGPVVVKASDVPSTKYDVTATNTDLSTKAYYVFDSVEVMQKNIVANTCTAGKTINYVQVILNPWNDTKQNKLVNADVVKKSDEAAAQNVVAAIKLADNWQGGAWNTPNADFVKKGTFEIQAKEHVDKVVTEEVTTAPTCQAEGVKTIKTVCQTCKKVIDTKTEAIPAITDPIEKNDASDYTKYAFSKASDAKTKHYVAKQEDTTSVDTATGMVTVTTNYTCNFGHVHTELAHVETFKKKDLQNSGKWDAISLDKYTALEQYNKRKGDLGLLKTVTVADTDIELTTVPMNRAGTDEFFKFDLQNIDGHYVISKDDKGGVTETWVPVETDADGNYFADQALAKGVDVYTSATGLPTTKYYAAKLTVKDIKVSDTDCEDASCTVAVDVYEVAKATATATNTNLKTVQDTCQNAIKAANLEENLKNKKVTLVKSYSESVVIPGKGHQFFNSLGQATELCTKCGAKKPTETESVNPIDPANVTVENLTYTGKAAQPKVIVKDADGFALIEGTDYVVSVVTDTAVGEYTISIKGIGTYAGNKIQKTFKIVAAAKKQTLKASTTKKTFKVKNLKKKKASFTTKLSGAKTAVTWKSSNAKVTVKGSKTKATITVKKGTKKGTYKVTATAKKTADYKKGSITIKVIVK